MNNTAVSQNLLCAWGVF